MNSFEDDQNKIIYDINFVFEEDCVFFSWGFTKSFVFSLRVAFKDPSAFAISLLIIGINTHPSF